jgi:NitT/TauT family transport system substrate-binding protein
MRRRLTALLIPVFVAFALLTAACGDDSGSASAESGTTTLHLGYFANITHGSPLVGIGNGTYAKALGSGVDLKTSIFGAGTEEIEALFAGAIDAGYIGPNPAVNGYVKSNGEALRIVAGATSGGAALVVKPDINGPQDLKGKVLATPSLGNTQDVALRAYLKDNGLSADTSGGGDVSIHPQDNSQTLDAFKADTVQGAWVPEPWATRLVVEGGGKVLVDEATLWPEGKFATTELIVSKKFLDAHPDVVKKLIEAQVETEKFIADNPDQAEQIANQEIEKITGKKLADGVLGPAFKNLTFTNDPVASSVQQSAEDAHDVGLLDSVPDLKGLFDLTILNEVLKANGEQPVAGL